MRAGSWRSAGGFVNLPAMRCTGRGVESVRSMPKQPQSVGSTRILKRLHRRKAGSLTSVGFVGCAAYPYVAKGEAGADGKGEASPWAALAARDAFAKFGEGAWSRSPTIEPQLVGGAAGGLEELD